MDKIVFMKVRWQHCKDQCALICTYMTSSKIAYPPGNFCNFNSLKLLLVDSEVHFSTTVCAYQLGKVHHHLTVVKF